MAKRSKRQAELSQAQKLKMREKWRRQKTRQRQKGREAYEEARRTGKPAPRNSGSFIPSARFQRRKTYELWKKLGRPEHMRDAPKPPFRRSRPEPFQRPSLPTTVTHISAALWDVVSSCMTGGRTPNTSIHEDRIASAVAEPPPEARAEPPPRSPLPLNRLLPEDRAYLRSLRGPPELLDFGSPPPNWLGIQLTCPDWLDTRA